jgi:Zn-dependent M28 family amino/carboxypeptidase
MISVREARSLQQRLSSGERITLHAVVKARNDDSMPYETLVATIPGTDSSSGDIVFSCHLDHEKPGANDNASGCSANLEIARALRVLIAAKRIPAPVRTIRFVWPSEMTGTIAYLSKYPAIASRIRAAVHLDMVGGDPFVTKSILHVTRSPWSIATVTDDVQETFGRYVIDGAMRAAGDGDMARAIRSPRGSKDALWADITPYESGSDHWIYQLFAFPPSTFATIRTSTFIRPATWPTTLNRPSSNARRSSPPPAATTWRRCRITAHRCCVSAMRTPTSVWRKTDAVRRQWQRPSTEPTP